jgi:hypothetical protein
VKRWTLQDALSESARRVHGVGVLAIGAAALAGVVVVASLWPVGRALVMRASADPVPSPNVEAESKRYAQALEGHVAAIRGRSLFFVPPPPPVTIAERPRPTPPPAPPRPVEPPKPTIYTGPAIQAIVFDTVWLADGKKIRLGEAAKDDLALLRIDGPWGARIAYRGTEFDVPFFDRDRVIYPAAGAPAPKSETPTPTTPPAEAREESPKGTPAAPGAEGAAGSGGASPAGDLKPADAPSEEKNQETKPAEPTPAEPKNP